MITMSSQLSFINALVLLSCILIALINIPPCRCGNNLNADCSAVFNCGDISVTYPFWGENRPYGCGYDQLKVTCETGVAKINIANVKYRLLEYFPDIQVMQIARDDYASGLCSPNHTDTTLDPTLFVLVAGYIKSSLSYGCPADVFAYSSGHFSCSVNGTSNTDGYLAKGDTGIWSCFASVMVPNLDFDYYVSSVEDSLRMGFKVRLKVNYASCDACIRSRGFCGYDNSVNQTTCYCESGIFKDMACPPTIADAPRRQSTNGSVVKKRLIVIAVCATAILLGIVIIILAIWLCRRRKLSSYEDNISNIETVINKHGPHAARRYKYFELKKITNSFSEKIGQGGYGIVYKGKLPDGQVVAVKLLIKSKGHGEEFINEVVSISRTSHVNIVGLLGFCYERNKRALIYEFMPNGSLDKFIPSEGALHSCSKIDWNMLQQIALDIARGLEYLHRGCKTRILHFDIKPQNILLDEDFIPKISDFGLAKLCLGKESIVSLLDRRGTIGYIAPEVFSRNFGRVSHKSDVYSYGMLVLTMIWGKCVNNDLVSDSSDLYFPHDIYKQLEPNRDFKFQGIATHEEEEIARNLTLVSFWCIQTNPSDRPSITKVLDMLEQNLHSIDMPPEPFLTDTTSQHQSMDMASASSSSNKDGEEEESSLVVDRN